MEEKEKESLLNKPGGIFLIPLFFFLIIAVPLGFAYIWTSLTYSPPTHKENSIQRATFHDYYCEDDCSGHEAGYEWAKEKGIEDATDCGGNSYSFIDGCRIYVEEN